MDLESLRYFYLRRVVGTALSVVGLEASQHLACSIARRVYRLNTSGRRRAEARLADAAAFDANDTIPVMYDHIARFWVEALFARRRLTESSWRRSIAIENEPSLTALAAERRGGLFATAYFGNPAVCAFALGEIFRPIHVVADRFAHPILHAWQRDLFAWRNIRIIDRRDAASALPQILDRKGTVLMIGEHERTRGPSVPLPFLGRTLNCYPTLARLSKWYDVPVAVTTCRRETAPFTFTLQTHGVFEPPAADVPDCDILKPIMAALERAILQDPEQYLWALAGGAPNTAEVESSSRETASLIDRGSESASCRTPHRRASAPQTPSWAGSKPAGSASAVEPVPTA